MVRAKGWTFNRFSLVPAEVHERPAVAVEEIQVLEGVAVQASSHHDNDGVVHQLLPTGGDDGRRIQRAHCRRRGTTVWATADLRGDELGPPRTVAGMEVVGEAGVPPVSS